MSTEQIARVIDPAAWTDDDRHERRVASLRKAWVILEMVAPLMSLEAVLRQQVEEIVG